MKSKRGYLPEEAKFPFLGMDLVTPSTQLPAGASPSSINFTTFRGTLEKRGGYALLGSAIGGGTEPVVKVFNFMRTDGLNRLVACTPTRMFSWDGSSWSTITPTVTAARFTKISAGNGWTATGLTAGDYVKQSTFAAGVYIGSDATYHYVAVTYGVFRTTASLAEVTTSGTGSMVLSGTDPNASTITLAKFPLLSDGVGWSIVLGSFTIGYTVTQDTSNATGVWMGSDASFYYVRVVTGTFDDQHDITITQTEGSGTLSFSGVVEAATATTTVAVFPKETDGDGWSQSDPNFAVGDSITQATSGATGTWLHSDSLNFYAQVVSGTFDATHSITSGGKTLTVAGTVSAFTQEVAKFPKAKWSIADGAFATGQTVVQVQTGATGIWMDADGSFYYIHVTAGAFGDRSDITVTTTGGNGTLSYDGTTGNAATTTTSVVGTTSQTMPWTGTEADYIDNTEGIDVNLGRVIVLVNGKDPPIYWNGTDSTMKLLPINLDNFCTAKSVGVYNSYLVFANVVTHTDREFRTAVWSDTGNFQQWLDGNAGILAEMAFQGEILRLIPFTDKLIVFARNSIGCICYVDPDVIFGSRIYVTGLKVAGPNAVVNVNPFLLFAGQDNVYLWDGGSGVSPVGDKIVPFYKANQNKSYLDKTILFFDSTQAQVRFVIQTGAAACKVLLEEIARNGASFYDLQKSQTSMWFEYQYADRPTAFGVFPVTASGVNFSNSVIGSDSGKVFLQQTETDDAGTTITATHDTPDFCIPGIYQSQYARWLEIEFEASGSSVLVYYSVDQGANWTLADTVTLTTAKNSYRVNIDVNSRYLRLKFYVIAASFSLQWYRVWFRPGGAH